MRIKSPTPKAALIVALMLACALVCAVPPFKTHAQQEEGLAPGRYYALVIGNNGYQHYRKLKMAVDDAKDVAAVLQDQYGFQTKLLLDANRQQILSALTNYRRELNQNDNLLIYYAGHGYNDKDADKAY